MTLVIFYVHCMYTAGEKNPATYDAFTNANPHLLAMNAMMIEEIRKHVATRPLARVVEIGAGTGLFASPLANVITPREVIAVESDRAFYEQLCVRARHVEHLRPVYDLHPLRYARKHRVDAIALRITYHHIPNRQKLPFLRHTRTKALSRDGLLVIGEECLEHYRTASEREEADRRYHAYRIELARRSGNVPYLEEQKRIAREHGCPYKVSADVLCAQLARAGFRDITVSVVTTHDPTIDLNAWVIECSRPRPITTRCRVPLTSKRFSDSINALRPLRFSG